MPFHDPDADAALFRAIHDGLDGHPFAKVFDSDHHINDPDFAVEAASTLRLMMAGKPRTEIPPP
jgi:uncharacterized protein (UPF0261 family)